MPYLLQQAEEWPADVARISVRTWNHIIAEHSPNTPSDKTKFAANTDIAAAIYDTVTLGRRTVEIRRYRQYELVVNIQNIIVPMRRNNNPGHPTWYIPTAHPEE